MQKSLGDKRKEIPKPARDEIVKIYQAYNKLPKELEEFSKIFDSKEFGYREIRVERPLRLNFVISKERLDKLRDEKTFLKLEENEKEELIEIFPKLNSPI